MELFIETFTYNVYLNDKLLGMIPGISQSTTLEQIRVLCGLQDSQIFQLHVNYQNQSLATKNLEKMALQDLIGKGKDLYFIEWLWFYVYLDLGLINQQCFPVNTTINQFRTLFNNELIQGINYLFCNNGQIIQKQYENNITIKECLDTQRILNLKKEVLQNPIDQFSINSELMIQSKVKEETYQEEKPQQKQDDKEKSEKIKEKQKDLETGKDNDSDNETLQKIKKVNITESDIEQQNQSFEDCKTMINCFEKSLKLLIYYTFQKLNSERFGQNDQNIDDFIKKEIYFIQQNMEKEDISQQKILELINQYQESFFQKQLGDLQSILSKIMELYRKIDFQELFRLSKMTDKSAETITNQDIILFLGPTGAGKSTTILYLLGLKMHKFQKEGITHIEPIEAQKLSIKCNPFARSETRYITSVKLSFKEIDYDCEDGGDNVYLCDSPGFGDTAGPEVDIANAIGIINAIRNAKSVRPVVSFNYQDQGGRMQGIKEVSHILVGMLKDFPEVVKKISFIFSKFPLELQNETKDRIEDVLNQIKPEDRNEQNNYFILVRTILKGIKKKAIHIDPLNGKPAKVLDYIYKRKKIKNPDVVFNFNIERKTEFIIKEQLTLHQESIKTACKKNNTELIHHKLQEIITFDQIIEYPETKKALKQILNDIEFYLQHSYDQAIRPFNKSLKLENQLSEEDIVNYKQSMEQASSFETIRKKHLPDATSYQQYIQNILSSSQHLLEDLKLMDNPLNQNIRIIMDKLKLLKSIEGSINEFYSKGQQIIIDLIKQQQDNMIIKLKDQNFDDLLQAIENLEKIHFTLKTHMKNENDILDEINTAKKQFINLVMENNNMVQQIVSQKQFNQEDYTKINTCFQSLESAAYALNKKQIINDLNINEIIQKTIKEIITRIEDFSSIIKDLLKNNPEEKLQQEQIESLFTTIHQLRNIENIRTLTVEIYLNTKSLIVKFVEGKRDDILNILNLTTISQNTDLSELAKNLQIVENAQWIENYQPGTYLNIKQKTQERIIKLLRLIGNQITKIPKDFNNCSKLKEVDGFFEYINTLKDLEKLIDGLPEEIESIKEQFFTKIISHLDIVIQTFSEEKLQNEFKLNLQNAELYLNYVCTCEQIQIINDSPQLNITILKINIQNFLRNYSQKIFDLINENLSSLNNGFQVDRADANKKAQIILNRLKEIKEIQVKDYKLLNELFNNQSYNEWQSKLRILCNNYEGQFQQLIHSQENQKIVDKLDIIRCLSELDCFFENQQPFQNLYNRFQEILLKEIPIGQKQIIEYIENYKYSEVQSQLYSYQVDDPIIQKQYISIKNVAKSNIEQLIEQSISQASCLKYELITSENVNVLVKNIKNLSQAKQYLGQEVLSVELYSNIDSQVQLVYNLIFEAIEKEIQSCSDFVDNNNFPEASDTLNNLDHVCSRLQNSPNIVDIKKIINNQQEKIQEKLKQIIQDYYNNELQYLQQCPPIFLFQKLEKDIRNQVYLKTTNQIQVIIQQKFENELNKLSANKFSEHSNMIIKNLQKYLKYLPDTIKLYLQSEIESAIEQFQNQQKEGDQVINSSIQEGNFDTLIEIYKQKDYYNQKSVKQVENHIKGEISKYKDGICKNLKKGRDVGDSIEKLKEFINFKNTLSTNFQNEQQNAQVQIQNAIEKQYNSDANNLRRYFDLQKQDIIENEIFIEFNLQKTNIMECDSISGFDSDKLEEYDQCFQNINVYICNIKSLKLMIVNIQDELETMVAQIAKFFIQTNKNFENAIKINEVKGIQSSLYIMKKFKEVLKGLKINIVIYQEKEILNQEVCEQINNIKNYDKLISNLKEKIEQSSIKLQHVDIIEQSISQNSILRQSAFKEIDEDINFCVSSNQYKQFIPQITIQRAEESLKIFDEHINLIVTNCEKLISNPNSSEEQLKEFSQNFTNISELNNFVKHKQKICKENVEKLKKQVINKMEVLYQNTVQQKEVHPIIKNIVDLKTMGLNMENFTDQINTKIDKLLSEIRQKNEGIKLVNKIGRQLDNSIIGKIILSEHKTFDGVSVSLLNKRYQTHDLDYFLQKIEGDEIDKNQLEDLYNQYDQIYKTTVKYYLQKYDDIIELSHLNDLIDKIKLTAQTQDHSKEIQWNKNIRKSIPELLGLIFSLWTLMDTNFYFQAQDQDDQNTFLFQPHVGQILSILRILCLDNSKIELKHNLVQIGTGEGKSVTLAITSTILTLLGFNIYCVCYSSYLSKRDYDAFAKLFNVLSIKQYIKYSTFNELCESIINEKGSLRSTVENQVLNNGNFECKVQSDLLKRPKILLIDEVDVFFCKDFYGNIYSPSATLKDPKISQIIDYVWTNRAQLNYQKLIESPLYLQVISRFKGWEKLIEEVCKDLLYDVKNFESHDYIVKDGKIGYKEQDRIEFNISYGYKTLFAYYLEHSKNLISTETLEASKSFKINCGGFSYADIPYQFSFIMGVTGTLKTLSKPEKDIVQNEYKIKHFTFMPSAFGANNRRFDEINDCYIENQDDYYSILARQIQNKVNIRAGVKLAVLVFFETKELLQEFFKCKAFQNQKGFSYTLTEEDSDHDKLYRVKFATSSGTITLLTRAFGRGVDFICGEREVQNNGGVQVILTFLPEEYSEQVQIMGRTARQGEQGGFSLVLQNKDLEKYIGPQYENTLASIKSQQYKFICEMRDKCFNDSYESNKTYIKGSNELNTKSKEFLKNLIANKVDLVKEFLIIQNKGPEFPKLKPSLTIVLMDATGSMTGLLQKAKQTVAEMFKRAYEILKSKGISEDIIQIQFSVYRNYSSGVDLISQSSPWESKPDNLVKFMVNVSASGGMGAEAVEIGLQHAKMEAQKQKISQVIVIGDAPSNEEQVTISHRQSQYGENYWKATKFSAPTTYTKEIQQLNTLGVPLHTFYVTNYAQENFEKMGKTLSKQGSSQFLDINSSSGAQQLTDLVTIQILRDIGTQNGNGEDFVDSYKRLYPKNYG